MQQAAFCIFPRCGKRLLLYQIIQEVITLKLRTTKRAAALALAAALTLGGSAQALFGKKQAAAQS